MSINHCLSIFIYQSLSINHYQLIIIYESLSIYLPIYRSTYLFTYLRYLSAIYDLIHRSESNSIYLPSCQNLYLPTYLPAISYPPFHLSTYVAIYLYSCLSIYLSAWNLPIITYIPFCRCNLSMPTYLSTYLPVCVSIYRSIYLSIWRTLSTYVGLRWQFWVHNPIRVCSRPNWGRLILGLNCQCFCKLLFYTSVCHLFSLSVFRILALSASSFQTPCLRRPGSC